MNFEMRPNLGNPNLKTSPVLSYSARLDEYIFMAWPEPFLTGYDIHHRLESFEPWLFSSYKTVSSGDALSSANGTALLLNLLSR